MNRRKFIRTTGLSLAAAFVSDSLHAFGIDNKPLMGLPTSVTAVLNNQVVQLKNTGQQTWGYRNLLVQLSYRQHKLAVTIQSPRESLSEVTLHWKNAGKNATTILNDHWERTYGDVSWHKPAATEILPWYFMEHHSTQTTGFGVMTGAASFCYWKVGNDGLHLTLDTRSGGQGVQLGTRKLLGAEIVTLKSNAGESPFETTRRFTKVMCEKARMPAAPVYGINDWYFSYGNNSEKLILQHTEMMAPMAEGLTNRPFSVIDAGWFANPPAKPNDCCWGDNMSTPDSQFGDMGKLAEKIRNLGMRPGIWTRPLCASYKDPDNVTLPFIKGREDGKPVLDPTIPENLERIKNYFRLYKDWGYEMVKFDFTTFDIFGKWGFEMLKDGSMTTPGWKMHDVSKTNAEIIGNMYKLIRESAGDMYIIGCNTISHLSAGLFELNRIGDDTSGNEWDRTRLMGVNTLAFRGVQHGTFYAADGDCVGLTNKVAWSKNKQWMELLAKSGMPLFISAQPEATGAEQKQFIKESFAWASKTLPVAEPLDWMTNAWPVKWKLNGKTAQFDWT